MPDKICRYGDHPIAEDDRYYTFFTVVGAKVGEKAEPESYACEKHETEHRVDEFMKTRVLTTGLIMSAALSHDRRRRDLGIKLDEPFNPTKKLWFDEFMADHDRVGVALKLWEREVWFGGKEPHLDNTMTRPYKNMPEFREYIDKTKLPEGSLQAFVGPAKYKGYRADVDGKTYLSYTMCGRSIFQIETANGTMVGIILDENSPTPRGGIKGIHATADQAIALIAQAIVDWKEGKINLVHSDGVGLGF